MWTKDIAWAAAAAIVIIALVAFGIQRCGSPSADDVTTAPVEAAPPTPAPSEGPSPATPSDGASPARTRDAPASAERAAAAPPLPDAGETDQSGNDRRFQALHQALEATTPGAARLYADYARLGVTPPPEAKTLVEMKQRGAPRAELLTFVKSAFPRDLVARATAIRWLDVEAGAATPAHLPAKRYPGSQLGTLVRTDGGALAP